MIAAIARRLGRGVLVVLAVASLVFVLMHASGDPLAGFVPPGASPEQMAAMRERLGLDRPLPVQYADFLARAARLDFGDSWRANRAAMPLVLERAPATLRLAGLALALAATVGGALALAASARPGGVADALARGLSVAALATPAFWLGTMLMLVFAVRLQWLPSSGGDGWRALVLPALTLAAYPAGMITRLLRAGLLDAAGRDYARTAAGKGLAPGVVRRRHLLPNALVPTIAYLGVQAGFFLGAAVVVESVFAYPGVGRLAMQAALDRDLPVVLAFVVALAAAILIVDLVVETAAALIDPRLRGARREAGAW
jgi:ABC-type dipeptide/oligopeptide/nickel transport system permease component